MPRPAVLLKELFGSVTESIRSIWRTRLADALAVYVLTDRELSRGRSEPEVVRQAIAGGATAIQLRWKDGPMREAVSIARELKSICHEHEVLFVVNDRLDLAMAIGADGVHLGEDDLPVPEARSLVGDSMIIGYSPASLAEVEWAIDSEVDYLGCGPVYGTSTKDDAGEAVGVQRMYDVRELTSIPLVGIGGIGPENAAAVIEAGADGVAVISSVVAQNDIEQATRTLRTRVDDALARTRQDG
jgi:thiamine-phosphate pyrophosphorylase